MTVSLIAPTDGSTVGVRSIEVLGSVTPGNALVFVSGHRVVAHRGLFRLPLFLHRRITHIRIVAVATGYRKVDFVTTVRYSANPAARPVPLSQAARPGPSNTFVSDAEAICLDTNNRVTSLPPISPLNLAKVGQQEVSILADELRRLTSLRVPPSKTDSFRSLVSLLRQTAQADARILSDVLRGDNQDARSVLVHDMPAFNTVYASAKRAGIPDCGGIVVGYGVLPKG